MEVEAMRRHLPQEDFNFDSTTSSPFVTAPSSPQLFGFGGGNATGGHQHYYNLSAPASPTGSSSAFFFREFNRSRNSSSSIPFDWEEKPGIPKLRWGARNAGDEGGEDDFEFDFSGQLDIGRCVSASADELFDGGKIRPLKLPPRLQVRAGENGTVSLSSTPRATTRSRFSPKKRTAEKKDLHPFTKALEETKAKQSTQGRQGEDHQHRGRDRNTVTSSSSSLNRNYSRRGTRSLSPFRVSDIIFHDQNSSESACKVADNPKPNYFSTLLSSISLSSRGYRKWSFKDFLLFRSASEGRGTSGDPLRKFHRKTSSVAEDSVRSCSFRSTESMESSVSGRRRRRQSAHEVHYTVNRAASEEMRRKTFLPYKQGLLGCLGFNSGVHELARGIGSLTRGTSS